MNPTTFNRKTSSRVLRLATCFFILLNATDASARPDMSPLGPNIADKGSAFYHFTINTFDSADGQRHYKVWTAVPNKAPSDNGYPVLYMLDGNAVMDRLSDTLLQKMSAKTPPVLVVIGYQTTLPFEPVARTYDYTPASDTAQERYGRKGGGSALFRQLMEKTIAPRAEANLHIDPSKRAIWGHSFGGLFVLDSYLSSSFFNSFYAASPSLGRDNFALLKKIDSAGQITLGNKRLTLMEGDGDPRRQREPAPVETLNAVSKTITGLKAEGLPATYRLYPGLSHGQMFGASLESTLEDFSQKR